MCYLWETIQKSTSLLLSSKNLLEEEFRGLYTIVPKTNQPPGDNYVKNGQSYPSPNCLRRMCIFQVIKKRKIFLKSSHDPESNLIKFLHSFFIYHLKNVEQNFNILSYLDYIFVNNFTLIFYSVMNKHILAEMIPGQELRNRSIVADYFM